MTQNLTHVAAHYLKTLQVNVTTSSLKKVLEQNPYYPSLYSLSKAFNHFNIPNQAVHVNPNDFQELEAPFISHFHDDFILITKINGDEITYLHNDTKPHRISKQEFLKDNKKIVVFAAEGDVKSGEKDYEIKIKNEKRKQYRKTGLAAGGFFLILCVLFLYFTNIGEGATWPAVANAVFILIAKLLGIGSTLLLLTYEIDKSNTIVSSICSSVNQFSCDAVLNSKANKIWGISLSDIGFYYFSGTALFLLFPGIAWDIKLPLIALVATLVSPYILFSLYYQWRIVKQWCPLCLVAVLALTLEVAWSVESFWSTTWNATFTPYATVIPAAFICISFPVIGWNLLKPILLKAKEAPDHLLSYKRLLYNPETFTALLQQQPAAPDGWQNLGILLGNPHAKNTIIKVCNPYCGPCAEAHPVLEDIIASRDNDFNVRVIYTASAGPDDHAGAVVRHLLAVQAQGNQENTVKAMDHWYLSKKKDYASFAVIFPMNGELKQQDEKIKAMSNWCDLAQITYTPTVFIYGKRLPENYRVEELKNIL